MTRTATALAALLAAAAFAGCGGVPDPYNDTARPAATTQTTPTADATAEPAHNDTDEMPRDTEDPGKLVSNDAAADADAEEVATAYGLAQTNWSYKTYDEQYDRMTALAGGALGQDLRANPPEKEQLEGIRESKQTNRSKVVAVDSTSEGAGRARVIVVLREVGGGAGVLDMAPRHAVYRADVQRLAEGWRIVEWTLLPS